MPLKEERPPYPLCRKFPSTFERNTYRFYNLVENRLWPVRPLYFGASIAAAVAFHTRFPSNSLISFVPSIGEHAVAEAVRLGVVSIGCAYVPVFFLRTFLRYFYFSYKGFLFENPKKPSLLTKLWAVVQKLLRISPPLLKSCDALLPRMGVPPLDDTVSRFLESIRNLHSEDELEVIKKKAHDFLSNEGRKLQRYAWCYSLFTSNYVTPFWEKYAYLYNRECLLVSSSVAHIGLIKDPPAIVAVRAAHIIYVEMLSQLGVDRQAYTPLGEGLLCAGHYDKLYAVARVPGETVDHLENHGIASHVLVIYNGGLYKVEVADKNKRLYSVDQLSDMMTELLSREGTRVSGAASRVPALTHDRREQWARNRQRFFLGIKQNKEALYLIESASFVVNIDDGEYDYVPENPKMLSAYLKEMLTGHGDNRWVDKSLNYTVSKNTRCGGTTEHSIADGSEFDHIMENWVKMETKILGYPSLEEQKARAASFDVVEAVKDGLRLAERIEIEVTPEMEAEIERCYSSYSKTRDDVDLAATFFREFGKGRIKKCGVSPDAFMQMAIQLANYRDQGRFVLTYEPASSRFYANSRTETLRTVTDKSCAFVRAMLDEKSDRTTRAALLKEAAELHTLHNKECMVNMGVDRHIFVLFVLSQATGTSSPFLDHCMQQQWLLSTSHVPNVTNMEEDEQPDYSWLGACFGAVAKQGYGVCYRFAGNHSIGAHISSYHSAANTDSTRFQKHLVAALHEMSALFD